METQVRHDRGNEIRPLARRDCMTVCMNVQDESRHEQEIFVCAKYRKHRGCTPHQIHNVQVEGILIRELRRITAYAREHEDDFIRLVTKQSETELNRQLCSSNRELEQADECIGKLDSLIQRLYEDNVEGKISDERFTKLSAFYEAEQ